MIFLAAIQQQPAPPDPLAGLRSNASTVPVPWPDWVWWCIGLGAVVVIALLAWLGYWLAHRKPTTVPLTPRQIALRALDQLRADAAKTEPYQFSVHISEVLRTYISGHYRLKATNQTSPEFLASIGTSPHFTEGDRMLLGAFLERCDLLKFARVQSDEEENVALFQQATAFVQSARDTTVMSMGVSAPARPDASSSGPGGVAP
jgi:hypothetical protein